MVVASGFATAAVADSGNSGIEVSRLQVDIQVATDGAASRTVHSEIKANNDAEAMRIAQTNIAYDASLQQIEIVEAHTLKADGHTVPVNATAIYDEMPAGLSQAPMFTDQHLKVIVFPQFAAGDTAVYTARIITKQAFFTGHYWYGDIFPRAIPYDSVDETITAPRTLPLHVETHGPEFSQNDEGPNIVYHWHYAAPDAQADAMPLISPLDSEPRFFASSFNDYAELGREYALLSEPRMAPTPEIAALADQITDGISDRREQAQKLYEWVSGHIRYVAIELGKGSYAPHDANTVVANGYGDCKDHVVLLGALLKAKGIDSESVLLNAQTSYTLTEVPTFAQLDHVITWLPEFKLYVDASQIVAPFGVLPLQEYGKPAVHATLDGAHLAAIPPVPEGAASVDTKTDARVDKNGQLTGTTTTTATGSYAIMLRSVALGVQTLGADQAAAQQLGRLGYTGATGTFQLTSPVELAPDYSLAATFTVPNWNQKLDGAAPFFVPGGLRVLGLSGDGPLGPLDPRDLNDSDSVLCFSAHASEELSLSLPDGYHFNGVPDDTNVETPYLHFTAHWAIDGGTLTVQRDFTSKIDASLCAPDVRAANADALKLILDQYNSKISIAGD